MDHPQSLLTAKYEQPFLAKKSGYVTKLVANELGIAAMLLGAGRRTKEEEIDYAVGLKLHKKVGDKVTEGEPLLTIYSNDLELSEVEHILEKNIEIGEVAVELPLIHEIITE